MKGGINSHSDVRFECNPGKKKSQRLCETIAQDTSKKVKKWFYEYCTGITLVTTANYFFIQISFSAITSLKNIQIKNRLDGQYQLKKIHLCDLLISFSNARNLKKY